MNNPVWPRYDTKTTVDIVRYYEQLVLFSSSEIGQFLAVRKIL